MRIGSIIFATSNEGKLKEAKAILGVSIKGTSLEIDEIQSIDPEKVAIAKAKAYFEKIKKPVFVEDVSLGFKCMNGLPGTYINDFTKALGNEGLIDLLRGVTDRDAVAQTTIVYIDGKGTDHVFTGKIKGKISEHVRGEKGFGWDPIFIPDGETRTFAEMDLVEKNKYSMRALALESFAEWLSSQK